MHDHDFDLIAQLAEGSLLGGDLQAAEEAVRSCADCRVEFDAQTFILGILGEMEPARLNDLERTRLHRTVTEATMAPIVAQRRRSPVSAWLPKLAVAAAAAAFVGVVGVGLANLGSGDQASSDFAAESAVAEDTNADALASEEAAVAGAASAVEPADGALTYEESTEAAQGAVEESGSLVQPLDLGVISRDSFEALTFERANPGVVPERTGDQVPLEPFPFACVGAAVGAYGAEEDLNLAGVAVLEGRVVEIFGFTGNVFAFDPKTCDLVDSKIFGR